MGCGASSTPPVEEPKPENTKPVDEKKPPAAEASTVEKKPKSTEAPKPTEAAIIKEKAKEEEAASVDHRGTIEEQEKAALTIQNEARRKAALEEVAKRKAAAAADPRADSKGHAARTADTEAYDAKLMAGKAGKVQIGPSCEKIKEFLEKAATAIEGGGGEAEFEAALEEMGLTQDDMKSCCESETKLKAAYEDAQAAMDRFVKAKMGPAADEGSGEAASADAPSCEKIKEFLEKAATAIEGGGGEAEFEAALEEVGLTQDAMRSCCESETKLKAAYEDAQAAMDRFVKAKMGPAADEGSGGEAASADAPSCEKIKEFLEKAATAIEGGGGEAEFEAALEEVGLTQDAMRSCFESETKLKAAYEDAQAAMDRFVAAKTAAAGS